VVYHSGGSAELLEIAALAAITAGSGALPTHFENLLRPLVSDEDFRTFMEVPWFSGAEKTALPWATDIGIVREAAKSLTRTFAEGLASAPEIVLRTVPAITFNASLGQTENKASTVWAILKPLMQKAIADPGRVSVDRLGGRRYYGDLLAHLVKGGEIEIIEEQRYRSRYRVGRTAVSFTVRGDSYYLETALASVIAKYVRETSMRLFNAYWEKRIPGIRPTAGYPADADRFVARLEEAGVLPENIDLLIRKA
jgi:ribonuclease HII